MKNFMLLVFPFISIRFLFVGDRFSEYATIVRGLCGWSDIIEVLLDCDACFFSSTMLLLCDICPRNAEAFFKAVEKGRKRKTRREKWLIDNWQLSIFPCLLLPACCQLFGFAFLCELASDRASAIFPAFNKQHINSQRRRWRWRTNFIDIQLLCFFSGAFVVSARYAPINIKHINNQFYYRFLPLPLFTHMALWNISRQFHTFI